MSRRSSHRPGRNDDRETYPDDRSSVASSRRSSRRSGCSNDRNNYPDNSRSVISSRRSSRRSGRNDDRKTYPDDTSSIASSRVSSRRSRRDDRSSMASSRHSRHKDDRSVVLSRRSSRRSGREDDNEIYPDDSSSVVSSRVSSRSSRSSRQPDYQMVQGQPMMMNGAMMPGAPVMFTNVPMMSIPQQAPGYGSGLGRTYGGRQRDNSRAVVPYRNREVDDDTRSCMTRQSRRATQRRDTGMNERASEQSARLFAQRPESRWSSSGSGSRSRSRSRSRSSMRSFSRSSRRSRSQSSVSTVRPARTARPASRREDMPIVRRPRSSSRSLVRSMEQEISRRDHELAQTLQNEEWGRPQGLRDGPDGIRYSSGLESLDISQFGAGDEVDLKQKKNIEKKTDGSVVISDELDVKLRFGGDRPGGR